MIRIFLLTLFISSLLHAKSPEPYLLKKANGSSLDAKPVGLDGEKFIFVNSKGKRATLALSYFSAAEQKNLLAWKVALEADKHHFKVVQKIKAAETAKVLFIGNSYNFKVPKTLEKLATSKGKKITVDQITKGGWTLKKHANAAKHIAKIQEGNYNIVVLQEQSIIPSLHEGQRSNMMDEAAKKLVETIRKSGAEPVFFQTWGRRDGDKQNAKIFPNDTYEAMQKRLNKGYANVAKASGDAHVIPIGTLWGSIMKSDIQRALKFYSRDGSHPSKNGVDFAALVIYSALYDETTGDEVTDTARLKSTVYPVK